MESEAFRPYAEIVAQSLVDELGLSGEEAARAGANAGSWPLFTDSADALRRLRAVEGRRKMPGARRLALRDDLFRERIDRAGNGLVVDLPTAFYVTAVQVPDGKVVGQFPSTGTCRAARLGRFTKSR